MNETQLPLWEHRKLTGEMLYQEHIAIFPHPYGVAVQYSGIHQDARERWEKLATSLNQKLKEQTNA